MFYLKKLSRQFPILKNISRIIVWPIDFLTVLIVLPTVLLYHKIKQKIGPKPNHEEKVALLFITFGGGLNKHKKKIGNLELLKNWDGSIKTLDQTIWLMYRSDKTGLTEVKDDSVFAFEQRRVLGIFHYLGWLFMVARGLELARKFPVKIVRSKDPFLCGLCGWIIARMTGNSFCISIHTDYDRRLSMPSKFYWLILGSLFITRKLVKFLFSRADRIFPIRKSMIPWIREHGGGDEQIRVFPHGVDCSKFNSSNLPKPPENWPSPEKHTIISWAGRLDADNFAQDLIEMTLKIVRRKPQVKVMIAGDGEKSEQLRKQVQEAELEQHVHFLGWIEQPLVYRLRKNSLIALELNGGFSLLEAGAAGCALMAYDVEWHDEVVVDETTGYLLEPGDIEGAINCLIELIENPKKAKRFGKNARKLVRRNFSKQATAKMKDRYYRELLNE